MSPTRPDQSDRTLPRFDRSVVGSFPTGPTKWTEKAPARAGSVNGHDGDKDYG